MRRPRPAALVVGAACIASLVDSTVQSTVLVTVAVPERWLGAPELAVRLGFVVWGLAASRRGGTEAAA